MEANQQQPFYDFVALPMAAQLAELWQGGVHLETFTSGVTCFRLYRLHGFYVEVVTNAGSDVVRDVRAFLGGPLLDKYLERTDLSDLYNED